jgi:hypothetical protein
MPRPRPNSRVKDLPDLALIASAGALEAQRLRAAIEQTFRFRDTHPVPDHLPSPSSTWEGPYAAIANEDELQWSTLGEVFVAARSFLDPVLGGPAEGRWEPDGWFWRRGRE